MRRLRDLLPKKMAAGPGFGISKGFYLSVLSSARTLPTLAEVMNPDGAGGAVAGYAVPGDKSAGKEVLGMPLKRGEYGLASKDKKTLIRMTVIGKDEAGFSADALLKSPEGQTLRPEIREGIGGAWNIIQLLFGSYDPTVHPAIDLILACAQRLAKEADGIVADPLSLAYRLPDEVRQPANFGLPYAVEDVVSVADTPNGAQTRGLLKFDLPELLLVGQEGGPAAKKLIEAVADELRGTILKPGATWEGLKVEATEQPAILALR